MKQTLSILSGILVLSFLWACNSTESSDPTLSSTAALSSDLGLSSQIVMSSGALSSQIPLSSSAVLLSSSSRLSSSQKLSSSIGRYHDPERWRTLDTNMVTIPAGCFVMGYVDSLSFREHHTPHTVCVSSFKIDPMELQEWQWLEVMKYEVSFDNAGTLDTPAESMRHSEAVEYCAKIGKRLPTEAEWEWAAKGGSKHYYSWGPDTNGMGSHQWLPENARYKRDFGNGNIQFATWKQPVGLLKPNGYGLYDMEGNISEWVSDYYGPIDTTLKQDPKGAPKSDPVYYVWKGWSFDQVYVPLFIPAFKEYANDGQSSLGFRCALDLK
jgi:formylglycine-generating enzyme required for sulfatase activity